MIAAMKGMKWESPRGPMSIDPETCDVVHNEYIRKVERANGQLYNVEFATVEAVKDPTKAAKKWLQRGNQRNTGEKAWPQRLLRPVRGVVPTLASILGTPDFWTGSIYQMGAEHPRTGGAAARPPQLKKRSEGSG
jgi:hypothetical protein